MDCCATRLRCTVFDPGKVDDSLLKSTGASGVIHKGDGVQIIYGPRVTVIKSNLEDYLDQITGDESEEILCREALTVSSPITGIAEELSKAPDEAFAGKMMGDGAVVTPTDPLVWAPEDGKVVFVYDTKHALGFKTDSGLSLLIHIGIDTVELNGQGFEAFVSAGQRVKKGEPMLRLDLPFLKEHAPSLASPVLYTEIKEGQRIRMLREGKISAGEPLFMIEPEL